MPVPIETSRDPFRDPRPSLRLQQARVLAPLMPRRPDLPRFRWPVLTRGSLASRAGFTAVSGSITRALNGIRSGSSSGPAHAGLLALGLVEEVVIQLDGMTELNYRATERGVAAFRAWEAAGGVLPPLKDKGSTINNRYRKEDADGGPGNDVRGDGGAPGPGAP